MTGPWDEAAERERRGLPSKREQTEHGLTPEQKHLHGEMVRDRRAAMAAYRKEREAMEARGTALVETFARAGFSVSYEWRSDVPLVAMGLAEAERLLQAFVDLADAYELVRTAGQALGEDVARLLTERGTVPGPDQGQ